MKPEYLKRELTINRKSFMRLGAECAANGAQSSADLPFGLSLVLASSTFFSDAANILFGDNPDAKTFTGAEMLIGLITSAERQIREVATVEGEMPDANSAVVTAGFAMMMILDVMEKGFGSDADEENPNAEVSEDA